MPIIFLLAAVLAGLIGIGLFHSSVRRILIELFDPLRQLCTQPREALAKVRAGLQDRYLAFRRNEGMEDPNRFSSYFIGTLVFRLNSNKDTKSDIEFYIRI